MADGKTCNAIASNKASGKYYICGCAQSQFNNLEAAKARPARSPLILLGLSTLHAWIKFYERILHIRYRLNCKDDEGANVYQMKTPEHKKMSTAEKKRINVEFREASGLIIDQPKQGGDTSNDGNAVRRFFENAKESAEITGMSEKLIRRMHTI